MTDAANTPRNTTVDRANPTPPNAAKTPTPQYEGLLTAESSQQLIQLLNQHPLNLILREAGDLLEDKADEIINQGDDVDEIELRNAHLQKSYAVDLRNISRRF